MTIEKKVALIEVWMGKIPEYFSYHLKTIENLPNLDFYFFTNDREYDFSSVKNKNFNLFYITEEEFLERYNSKSPVKIEKILYPKKIVDFKLFYFEMFSDYIGSYPYVGIYDIDTLFGDINKVILESLYEYDFISVADEVYHNRLGGPLLIMRNSPEIMGLIKTERYFETLNSNDIYGYGEQELSSIAINNYKVKLIYSNNVEVNNGGKNTYDCFWSGGKIFINGGEKLFYHFLRKNQTKLSLIGNIITSNFDKKIVDDFYWVVSFTKSYESLFVNLLRSIKKYSNRKCIVYSINYTFLPSAQDLGNSQFIYRRIDISEGEKDPRGRDINIITSKPLINIDVINTFPGKKFVNIDSDIYFTVNSDNVGKYFRDLENYPLINSHVHDVIYLSGIRPDEEWTSSLHILAENMGINNEIFPRRKTNVILFDGRSKWFFEEQMEIYFNFKNVTPGILALHDEDTANVILWKYNLTKCLPLLDAEEVSNIEMEKFHNYSYSMTVNLSPFLVLPKNENEVLFFHGIKNQDHYDRIENNYGNSVIECEEFIIEYRERTLFFEKNSFLDSKKIDETVDFILFDLKDMEIFNLSGQNIKNYNIFYVSDLFLSPGKYKVSIFETNTKRCVFNDLLEVK